MEGVDPMLAMASSCTGVAPPSSPNALAVGLWDAQQLQVTSLVNPINPLLLASACFGSSAALDLLFRREDNQEPPLVTPNQEFLDLLVGYNPGSSTRTSLTVPQASATVEDGVYQPFFRSTSRLLSGVTAEGDTALHAVACHGDSQEFQRCARLINQRDQGLLFAVNRKGDTPLHCAARAGKSRVLFCLIKLAESCDRLHELLRMENVLKETALHDAVRIGRNDIVELLLGSDPDLANYPEEGTSPLYLAILLTRYNTASALYVMSNGKLSYSGPNGQNALHAAILRGEVMTKYVLEWNNNLATERDRDGSTPLHFAASQQSSFWVRQIFKANPAAVYQADNNGLFPIHVAASVGAKDNIQVILQKCPSSARLRTAQGLTFLHVAVENQRLNIVSFVNQTPSLSWILNMQDNDGNTALHLAIKATRLRLFCSLYENKEVELSLPNSKGETPRDLSSSLLRRGMYYGQNIDRRIHKALALGYAYHGVLRIDQHNVKYSRAYEQEGKIKETEKMKDASQILGLGSVLIATVAFGATFAVPGGFIADDHKNGGTPTLAGRYIFDAFMVANALAFISSSIATVGLMFSGSPVVDLRTRQINFTASVFFMSSSVTCLTAAFALGVYMVLAPVTRATAIVICAFSSLVVLFRNLEVMVKWAILARPLYIRMGRNRALRLFAPVIFCQILMEIWPYILIFSWAAIAQKIRNH